MNIRCKNYWEARIKNYKINERFLDVIKTDNRNDGEFVVLEYKFDKDVRNQLYKVSKKQDLALFIIVMAGIQITMSKYSGQKDANILIPSYGEHTENGMIWLCNEVIESMTVRDFISHVKQSVVEAINFQDYSFLDIVEEYNIDLYKAYGMLCTYNKLGGRINEKLNNSNQVIFELFNNDSELGVKVTFNAKYFGKRILSIWCTNFMHVISQMVFNANNNLENIFLKNDIEDSVLSNKNKEENMELADLIDVTFHKFGDRQSIIFCKDKWTYGQLDNYVKEVQLRMEESKVNKGDVVAVMYPASVELIAIILALWKRGATYLPIDLNAPAERIEVILNKSHSKYLIKEGNRTKISNLDIAISVLQQEKEECGESDKEAAYIIFTSGSTGEPKGVIVSRKSLVNTLLWRVNEYKLSEKDVSLQLFSNYFDGFFTSFFTPFFSGTLTVMVDEETRRDPYKIVDLIEKYRISNFIAVPTLFNAILDCSTKEQCVTLRLVTLAGEVGSAEILQRARKMAPRLEIANEYGPTEACVAATFHRDMSDFQSNNIGVPISSTSIYILKDLEHTQPLGAIGEIAISGIGLSKGYLNDSAQTKQKFVDKNGERIYLTGDLGRINENGEIEFWGRKDQQVKIRGYRIELDEIKHCLLRCDGVKDACSIVVQDGQNKDIWAFVVLTVKDKTIELITEEIKKWLPEYMLPTRIIVLDKLPYGKDFKIDRTLLRKKFFEMQKQQIIMPRNEMERELCDIWKEVLNKEEIGVNQNFFEIGGHSLKATILLSKLHKVFEIHITLAELFSNPTIEGLVNIIGERCRKEQKNKICKCESKPYYEASSAQKRMFVLDNYPNIGTSYNIPFAMVIDSERSERECEDILNIIISRHEALRTNFIIVNDILLQKIHESRKIDVKCRECVDEDEYEDFVGKFVERFNLQEDLLIRACLVKRLDVNEKILLIDMHHIIADGISLGIFMKEFQELLSGRNLQEVELQYRDFSEWQNRVLRSEQIKSQKEYWLNMFENRPDVLNLPHKSACAPEDNYDGDYVSKKIEFALNKKITDFCKIQCITPFVFYLSVYYIMMYKYSNQTDMTIGSPIANREDADLYNSFGMFVNMLPLRIQIDRQKSFNDFIQEVKTRVVGALENQTYQFEDLVRELGISANSMPLFNVMFEMENHSMGVSTNRSLKYINLYKNVSKYDISLSICEAEESWISIEYRTGLFEKKSIQSMLEHYITIINSVIENPEILIKYVSMITNHEKEIILGEFNQSRCAKCNETIQSVLEKRVLRDSYSVAIKYGKERISCKIVDEKSNQFTNYLIKEGVKKGDFVGLLMERSVDLLIVILGIIKAGAAYVPMDVKWPQKRKNHIIESCCPKYLIVDSNEKVENDYCGSVLDINKFNWENYERCKPSIKYSQDDVVYVIYTSGTTGIPKGVMVTQKNLMNLLQWMQITYPCEKEDCYLLKTSYSFDVSTTEIFAWILGNGSVAILEKEKESDPEEILNSIQEYEITHINFVPTMFQIFVNQISEMHREVFDKVKYIFLAGEVVGHNAVGKMYGISEKVKIVNLYGPTECTVYATYYDIQNKKYINDIPIGKPIQNVSAYVVDSDFCLQPVGIPGELLLGGTAVSIGYYHDDKMTSKRFISVDWNKDSKVYCTGDIVQWNADGTLKYLGRKDHQIKIRGYRIEKAEIEKAISEYPKIRDVVVVEYNEKETGKVLCAYIVGENAIDRTELREFLKEQLPVYMIPTLFIDIPSVPYTTSGKVNMDKLREYKGEVAEELDKPEEMNEFEKELIDICKELLGHNAVGIRSKFFDVGGHSLSAILLMNKLNAKYGIEIKLEDILEDDRLEVIARLVKARCEEVNSFEVLLGKINTLNKEEREVLLKRLKETL